MAGRTYCITCGKKYSKMRLGAVAISPLKPPAPPIEQPLPPPALSTEAGVAPTVSFGAESASWLEALPAPPPPDEEPPSGRPVALLVAMALTVALIGGGLVLVLRPSAKTSSGSSLPSTSSSASVPIQLTLAFNSHRPYRFHLVYTLDAWFVAPSEGYSRLIMKVDETAALRVLSVDRNGTTAIKMSIERGSTFVNGDRVRIPAGTTLQLRIARDGRILSTGGAQLAAPARSNGGLPSIDQFTPLLPKGAVTPGDTWVKDFALPYPLGGGTLRYHTKNQFVGYEDLSGIRAAMIRSDISVPVKLVIASRRFFEAAGADPSKLPPEAVGTLRYAGTMSSTQESWFDPVARRAIKATSHGTLDFHMKISGFQTSNSEIRFQGTFDTIFENLT